MSTVSSIRSKLDPYMALLFTYLFTLHMYLDLRGFLLGVVNGMNDAHGW